MEKNVAVLEEGSIRSKIHLIRGRQVMLDRDIAELYGVETRRLNEQVKRNIDRFSEEFMFQMNDDEFEKWKSQNATSNYEEESKSLMSHYATSNLYNRFIFR